MALVESLVALAVASFVLPLLFLFWIRSREREGRERTLHVLKAFAYGAILAVFVAGVLASLALVLLEPLLWGLPLGVRADILLAVLVAPALEEPSKALWLLPQRRRFLEAEDGLVYGAAIGLGFGAMENVGYTLLALFDGGVGFAVATLTLRSVGTVLLHGAVTALVGYGLTRPGNPGRRASGALAWLVLAIVLHGFFNLLATAAGLGLSLAAVGVGLLLFLGVAHRIRELDRLGPPRA